MNLLDNKSMQILAVIVLAVTIKVFMDHRRKEYKGTYNPDGSYNNITAVKHDMTKAFWVELFVILVMGIATGEKLYDPSNILGSWVGKTMVIVAAYFTFHEFIQPYVIDKLPNW